MPQVIRKVSPSASRRGTTFIELLISIGFIVILGVVIWPYLYPARNAKELSQSAEMVQATLTDARTNSVQGMSNAVWGVRFVNPASGPAYYELLKNSTVQSRTNLPASVTYYTSSVPVGNSRAILFSKLEGTATPTSVVLYQAFPKPASTTISVSFFGVVSIGTLPTSTGYGATPPLPPPETLALIATSSYLGSTTATYGNYFSDIEVADSYLYLAGTLYTGSNNWYIEKLEQSNLGVVYATTSSAGDTANAIAVDSTNGYFYVAGYDDSLNARVEKRRTSDGALCTAANCGTAFGVNGVKTIGGGVWISALELDSTNGYLYSGGQKSPETFDWQINQISSTSGAIIATWNSVPGWIMSDMALDATNGYIYTAGYEDTDSATWRIEKRRTSDGALCTAANCGTAFDTDGVLVMSNTNRPWGDGDDAYYVTPAMKIDVSGGYFIIGGMDFTNNVWRYEKRLLSTGAAVSAFGNSGVVVASSGYATDIILDTTGGVFYGVGPTNTNFTCTGLTCDWRVEERSIADGSLIAVSTSSPGGNDIPWAIGLDSTNLYIVGESNDYDNLYVENRYR